MLYMIEHSETIAGIFNKYCNDVEGTGICATRIKNLKKRKARFESCAKPMGRMIMWFDAVVMTALWVTEHRKNTEDESYAIEFLLALTPEALLTIAMVTDGGDETLRLIRYADTEQHDIAEFAMALWHEFAWIDCEVDLRGELN